MRGIKSADIEGKRVIVKVDWNVTLGKALGVIDDTRIRRTLPTLDYILEKNPARVVLISHLGRPGGKVDPELSLMPVVKYASNLWGQEIVLKESIEEASASEEGVVLLQNVRFFPGEKKNDPVFARELSRLGDLYVNEAFGESHRESASVVGIPRILPGYAGLDFMKEIEILAKIRSNPDRPFVVIVGGAKVEDKMGVLEEMSRRADVLLLGGKLANEYVSRSVKLSGRARVVVPTEGDDIKDIGEETIEMFTREIGKAKTVVWNGPMGKVEDDEYKAGTHAVYEALTANLSAMVVVGGGDTLSAIHDEKHLERIDFISTGGGAMLAYLERGTLSGIEAL